MFWPHADVSHYRLEMANFKTRKLIDLHTLHYSLNWKITDQLDHVLSFSAIKNVKNFISYAL